MPRVSALIIMIPSVVLKRIKVPVLLYYAIYKVGCDEKINLGQNQKCFGKNKQSSYLLTMYKQPLTKPHFSIRHHFQIKT